MFSEMASLNGFSSDLFISRAFSFGQTSRIPNLRGCNDLVVEETEDFIPSWTNLTTHLGSWRAALSVESGLTSTSSDPSA